MPRSHQTRSQYVLQNVAERGQTVCERNERCDNCLESFYELNGRFMNAVDGLEREAHSRTSRLLKILRRPSRSEIGRSDNVLKMRWTFYERNCRTSDLLGTHYNVVQSRQNAIPGSSPGTDTTHTKILATNTDITFLGSYPSCLIYKIPPCNQKV